MAVNTGARTVHQNGRVIDAGRAKAGPVGDPRRLDLAPWPDLRASAAGAAPKRGRHRDQTVEVRRKAS